MVNDDSYKTLDELRALAEELRTVFGRERAAIAALDHSELEQLAATKQRLGRQLAELREPALATGSAAVRDVFEAIRVEARATAMLAATANQAVRALLGYAPAGYDRRARTVSQPPLRILAER